MNIDAKTLDHIRTRGRQLPHETELDAILNGCLWMAIEGTDFHFFKMPSQETVAKLKALGFNTNTVVDDETEEEELVVSWSIY